MSRSTTHKKSFLKRISESLGLCDKAPDDSNIKRMEAFLSALPLEYCGWSSDGMVAYSRGFCKYLNVDIIHTIADIGKALTKSDETALDSHYIDLQRSGHSFNMVVKLKDLSRVLRLSGQRGQDTTAAQSYNILWLEDITDSARSNEALQSQLDITNKDHKKLLHLTSSLPMPLWMYNGRQELVWCNDAYSKIVDANDNEAVEKQKHLAINLGKEKGKVSSRKLAEQALQAKEPLTQDGTVIVEGERKTYHTEHFKLENDDLSGGFARDLTEENRLRNEISRYQSASTKLLENFSSAIAIFSADEKMEFYNSAFSSLWEIEEEWLNNRPKLGEIMDKLREQRKLPEQADFRAFKQSWLGMFTSLLQPHEDMLYLPDGRALRLMMAPHPLGGLLVTFDDVTSRLELESSYNTLIAVQRETLDNLAEGVAVFGSDGKLKLYNPPFLKLWDFKTKDLNDEPHITALTDQMKVFFDENTKGKKSSKKETKSENNEYWEKVKTMLSAYGLDRKDHKELIRRADGVYIELSQVALPDGGVMMTYRNVTDTMRVERALREKTAALEEAEKLKTDFLANVSYQLRTPLNAIMGFSEILSNEYFGTLNDRQKEYSEGISEAGNRLMSLIDNILDLSTIEAGYMTLTRDALNVHTVMQDIFTLTHDWVGKETLHAHIEVKDDIGMVLADKRRLKQALLNLVRNAISYTPGGGHIYLSAKREKPKGKEPQIVMSVRDTGIGIPEEDQKRVFEPFERGSVDDEGLIRQQNGTGLGLSLVKNIVDLHGGEVTIDSKLGEGTTISIVMPVYIED
jgi:signal transduction histidine kinase